MTGSKYDELHDRFYRLLSSKSGTRYERLAAVVFKTLHESHTVIHDLKLIGDSGVKHQIDVTLDRDGARKRVLIECKDFDISGDKVGLDIVRNFFGVVEDTKPDESFIITCNGFTRDAITYAKSKSIKLAILRDFREEDWQGRVKTIVVNMNMVIHSDPEVVMSLNSQADVEKHVADRKAAGMSMAGNHAHDPIFFIRGGQRTQVTKFIREQMSYNVHSAPGPVEDVVDTSDLFLEVETRGGVKVGELKVKYDVIHITEQFKVEAEKVATLLLRGVQTDDVVIWDDDLRSFRVDPDTSKVEPV